MTDLRNELREAYDASELTWNEVVRRSGVGCDQSSLLRKIAGEQPLSIDDAIRVAATLGVKTANLVKARDAAVAIGATVTWEPVKTEIPGASRGRQKRRAA